jgi:DNA-binding response OmpR family regulator
MKKIFILDDNEELLDILNRLLSKHYDLLLKNESNRVADSIIEFQPDLIILDHTIGEVNSTDVVRELRQRQFPSTVPVVLFSAHLQISEVAANIGARGFIEKPCEISYIREYIRTVLGDRDAIE